MTTLLFILAVLPFFLIVNYNIKALNYGLSPSFALLFTKRELRYTKGYDLNRLLIITFLSLLSWHVLIKYVEFLKSGFYDKSIISFLWSIVCAFGIILTNKYIRKHQPNTNREYKITYKDKNIKDEDLFEIEVAARNPENPHLYSYPNEARIVHPLLQNLNQREIEYKIITHSDKIIIDEINKKYLFDFFEGHVIPQKIVIGVVSESKKINYQAAIDFLHDVIKTKDVLIPNTNTYFFDVEIAQFVNDNFILVSSKGTVKKNIVANQFFYKKYSKKDK